MPLRDSLPEIRMWLARLEERERAANPHHKNKRLMSILHQINWKPVVLASFIFAVIGACALPMDQEVVLAEVLSGEIAQGPREARAVLGRFSWIDSTSLSILGEIKVDDGRGGEMVAGYVASGEATVNGKHIYTPTSKFVIVLPRATPKQIQSWAQSLRALPSVTSLEQHPLHERVKRSVMKAVLVEFSFSFDTELSEPVVERRIQELLTNLQMSGVGVRYVTKPDGSRAVELSGKGVPSTEDGERISKFLNNINVQ